MGMGTGRWNQHIFCRLNWQDLMTDWIWEVRENKESGQLLMLVTVFQIRKMEMGQESRVLFLVFLSFHTKLDIHVEMSSRQLALWSWISVWKMGVFLPEVISRQTGFRYMGRKGIRGCRPKICNFGIGLFWAEGNGETADAGEVLYLSPVCLNVGYKFSFVKVSSLPPTVPKRKELLITRDTHITLMLQEIESA